MKSYKIRAYIVVGIAKILSKIFFVELPPVISVAGFIKKDGKMLFLNLSYLKGYNLPGGIVQAGEDIEAALAREVKEETNLDATHLKYFTSVASTVKGLASLTFFFEVEAKGNLKDSWEGAIEWMNPEDTFGKLAYRNNEIALRKYLGK